MYRADCPFCPGNESQTTEETYCKNDGDQWSVRVVRNKFAALNSDQKTKREQEGMFLKSYGYGVAVFDSSRVDFTPIETHPVVSKERMMNK